MNISFDINNNQTIEVEQTKHNGSLLVVTKDSKGKEQTNTLNISNGDFITMLNWYRYQKEKGNVNLSFE